MIILCKVLSCIHECISVKNSKPYLLAFQKCCFKLTSKSVRSQVSGIVRLLACLFVDWLGWWRCFIVVVLVLLCVCFGGGGGGSTNHTAKTSDSCTACESVCVCVCVC